MPTGATAVSLKLTAGWAWRATDVSGCAGTEVFDGCTTPLMTVPAAQDADAAIRTVVVPLGGAAKDTVTLANSDASIQLTPQVVGFKVAAAAPPIAPVATTPGTVKPAASNTGVPAGTPALRVHSGDLTITTPGTVIDGLDIRGFVKVNAADVVIKNSIIRGRATSVQRALLTATSDAASVTIVDSELVAANPSGWIDGIRGWNITAKRVDIHGVVDGLHLYGDNVIVESSWVHDNLHYSRDPAQGGTPSHDDGIQIQVGQNMRFTGNTITGAFNSGFQLTQDAGDVSDVRINKNWLDGGGCTINVAEKGEGAFLGLVMTDNTFGRDTRVENCAIVSPTSTVITVARNFFTDGTAATVRRG